MATTKKEVKTTRGTPVSFKRRNGKKATGKVYGTYDAANGFWVQVNTAAPRQPAEITNVRLSELSPA